MPTVEQLVTLARVSLLEAGGVDNWEWYSESLENYGYVKSEDELEDAENLLEALRQGGVTNWDWYGDSIAGLDGYEEYLESFPNLDDVIVWDIFSWKLAEEAKLAAVAVAPVVEESVVVKRKPEGVAAEQVFAHIVGRFGADRAEDVFDLAIEKGLWKQTTFPKEFKKALKEIVAGVSNPLEVARQKLVTTVIKNGKLDVFLDEITEG
jgi:hypothetical protein